MDGPPQRSEPRGVVHWEKIMDCPRKRECLKCGKRFDSEGAGNRICPRCNTLNASVYQPKSAANPAGLSSFGEPTNFEVRKVGDV